MSIALYIFKLITVILLNILGIIGAVSPAIPGPPICLAALLIAYFGFPGSVGEILLFTCIGFSVLTAILDSFAPTIAAKLGGGSKWAIWGSTIGLVVGLFLPPFGIFWAPLLCAFVGELIADFKVGKAIKVAFLSFLSFIITIGLKLILCAFMSLVSTIACF